MVSKTIAIGRWEVEFYISHGREAYDEETVLERMHDFGAPYSVLSQARKLMSDGALNTGFTFSNPHELCAIVAIGPSSGGDEFINTLVHELHHLAVAIASNLGIDLQGEAPAYIAGDAALELAEEICRMGCSQCRAG